MIAGMIGHTQRAAVLSFLLIASCGTSVVYTPARRTARVEPPRPSGDVTVYDKSAPARPAVVIGTVATQPDSIYVDTRMTPELVAEMRKVAARAGCNAIVLDGATPAPEARYGGRAFATVSYRASCLVFTDTGRP